MVLNDLFQEKTPSEDAFLNILSLNQYQNPINEVNHIHRVDLATPLTLHLENQGYDIFVGCGDYERPVGWLNIQRLFPLGW